jgi:hypothetical protein
VPQRFITAAKPLRLRYPTPTKHARRTDFGGFWELELFPQRGGTEPSRLGRLTINTNRSHVLVLDGQHRANAFRYVAGCFPPTDAYRPFYQGVGTVPGYAAELPVSLIWFASKHKRPIQPTDISRELFVAVNNNARRVGEARTILLDDFYLAHVAVNTFYRRLAERTGFAVDQPSLLTACFDMDRDLEQAKVPVMALTNPIVLRDALSYAFFANDNYNDPCRAKATAHEQRNPVRFDSLFGAAGYAAFDDCRRVREGRRDAFRRRFEQRYLPVLELLLEGTSLVQAHY